MSVASGESGESGENGQRAVVAAFSYVPATISWNIQPNQAVPYNRQRQRIETSALSNRHVIILSFFLILAFL